MSISFCVAVYQNRGVAFVDDGSTDGSLDDLITLHEADPKVRVLTFTRNFGQMAAFIAGLAEPTGDAVINISSDLQDPVNFDPGNGAEMDGDEIVISHRIDRAPGS